MHNRGCCSTRTVVAKRIQMLLFCSHFACFPDLTRRLVVVGSSILKVGFARITMCAKPRRTGANGMVNKKLSGFFSRSTSELMWEWISCEMPCLLKRKHRMIEFEFLHKYKYYICRTYVEYYFWLERIKQSCFVISTLHRSLVG